MKFCDERIQKHLLSGGKIKRIFNNKDGNYRPILLSNDNVLVFADNEEYYTLTRQDLTSNNWEIVKPEYNWDKIIKNKVLCIFSDNEDFSFAIISTLKGKDENCFYDARSVWFMYCKPFKASDYNIINDLKEYEK